MSTLALLHTAGSEDINRKHFLQSKVRSVHLNLSGQDDRVAPKCAVFRCKEQGALQLV